jgi:hypothetical protein
VVAGTAQSATINTTFGTALQVAVKDVGGNPVSGATVTFTAPASGASGSFAGGGSAATAVTNAQGLATAPVLTANSTTGAFTVTAGTGSATAAFSLTNLAGAPTSLTVVAGTPQSATINTAFATALQVTVKDVGGNAVSGVTVTFTAPASGASGSFAGGGSTATAVTNAQGLATAPVLTANSTAGSFTVTAGTGSATAAFSLTNQAGAPTSLTVVAGTPQSATINTAFATALQVTVKDVGGNAVSGVTVTFTAPASGASGSFAGGGSTATAVTNAQGLATAPVFTANSTAGSFTVTAGTGSATAAFSLTNQAGAPAGLTVVAGTPQSATINTAFATALQAAVKDAGGNLLGGVTLTFTAPASGASGTFAGGGNTATAVTNAQGLATAPGFTANGSGGTFTINASVSGTTASGSFVLSNLEPLIGVNPGSVPFGNQPLRSSSAPAAVTIGNPGTSNLVINSLSTTGTSAGDYSIATAGTLPITVAPNTSMTVNVSFAPSAVGARLASLAIADNASGSPHAVALSGTGISAPVIGLNPGSVNFGSQLFYTASAPVPMTVANNGTADLVISSLAITGTNAQEFSLSAAGLPITVGVGNTTTINLVFMPGGTGMRTATLTIVDNAAGSPHTVGLSGTGTAPAVELMPAALAFPNQPVQSASAPATLMVSNTGNGNLVITTLTLTGADAGDFGLTAGTLPITVAAGNSAILSMTFTPRGMGTRTATLLIADNAVGTAQTVVITGTAISAPAVRLTPGSVTFGSQLFYTSSAPIPVMVANSGSADLVISSLSLTGANALEFSLAAAVLPITVKTGDATTLDLVFTPGAVGVRTATLTIVDNAAGSPHAVALMGTGTAPAVELTPAALTFPDQPMQSASAPATLTVSNTGNGNLVITTLTVTGADVGDFMLTAGKLPITVTAGNSTTLTMTFTPRAAGTRTATLIIADNAVGTAQTVAITGAGTNPAISVSPAAVSFGSQALNQAQTVSQPLAISNTGSGNLVISALTIAGANASDFALTAGTLPITVASGASANVNVAFTPTASGTREAALSISSNAVSSPGAVSLTGTGVATSVSVYPSALNLGSSSLNATSVTKYISISNTGGSNLVVSNVGITGSNAADFAFSWMTLPVTISPMGGSSIAVTFTPSATGNRSATLTITDNVTGSPQTVALTGTGTTPIIGITPANIDFGNQVVNVASGASAITISNSGTATLVISSLSLSGANPADFAFTAPATPIMVLPGGNATVNVSFTPQAVGVRGATLSLNDNVSGSPQTVTLSGTGTAPGIGMNPASLAFGSAPVNSGSTPAPLVISNPGTANLVISQLTVTGANSADFTFTAGTLPITVAPGGGTSINVTFTPSVVGNRAASLKITDNASGSPQAVGLSGTGTTAPGISLSPSSVNFGNQAVGVAGSLMLVTVSNTGTANLVIASLAIAGGNAADFSFTAGTLPITVTPGNSTSVDVTFTPSAAGSRVAALTLTDSAAGSPQTIALSGTGTAPIASLSPGSLNFGSQLVNTTSALLPITVSNSGTAALVISQLLVSGSNSGDFSLAAAARPIMVAPGNSTTLVVSFTPAAAGARSAVLNVSDNAGGSPQSVTLSGTGTASTASLSMVSALDLGSSLLNVTSATKQIAVSNTGSSNLVISTIAISGLNATEFAYTSAPLPLTVGPSGVTSISVNFTPAGTGLRAAILTLTDNATGSPQTVALTGTGTGTAIVALTPPSLNFGNQNVNSPSAVQAVVVGNTGTNALVISGVSMMGTYPGDFAYSASPLPITVSPGSTSTINVTFTPSAAGVRAATLQLADNASGSPQLLAVSGTGVVPALGISPSGVGFGNQTVATTSSATPITISNTGVGNLVISNLALSGLNAADFAFSAPAMPLIVASGNSATVSVTFSPSTTGGRAATLSVTDNASGSPQTVGLTGTGTPPAAGFSPSPSNLSFGNQPLSTSSAAQPITVSNPGTQNLVISSLIVSGADATDFSLSAATLPITVQPGGKTILQVAFTPGAAGTRAGTLSITDNASGSPQTLVLTGTGTAPGFSVSSNALSFGNQAVDLSSVATTLTVTNTGTANLVISSLLLSGANAGDFTFTAVSSPITIAAGGNTTIGVTFTPGAAGARSATLNITDNANGSPHTVSLSGTGIASGANINLSPTAINFGKQLANTPSSPASVSIVNSGTGNLVITALAITGTNASDFALAGRTLPLTVSPEGLTTLSVTFTPTAGGTRSANLSVTDNVNGSPQVVTLSGTGLVQNAAISISPTSVGFGNQTVGTSSAATPIVVTNTGTANLTVSNLALAGANSGDYAVASSPLPITVAPGNSTTIYATFTPAAVGSRSASLSITDNANGSPHSVALSGNGTTPTIGISPAAVAFGNQLALTTSTATAIVIGNSGIGNLVISNLAITPPAVQFQFTSNSLPITVASGQTATVMVTFSPTTLGAYSSSLSITTNASGSPQAVALSGTGVAPSIRMNPASVSFGNQLLGTTSAATAVTINNISGGSLVISNLALAGANAADFAFTSGTLPITIAAQSSTTVSVAFTPSATGSRTASLSLSDNGNGSPQTLMLSGTGTAPSASLSSASLSFGTQEVGTSTPLGVTVTNTGTGNLIISSIATSGANAADFNVSAGPAPITVTPGGNTIITVNFAPAATGSRAATLSIGDNSNGSPQTVALSGTGTAPISTISPGSVAFGNQLVNLASAATVIGVSNSGTANLVISSLAVTGTNAADFTYTAGTLPITITPGNRAYINLTFTPAAAGSRVAALAISDNTAASPETVPLSGTGTAAVAGINPVSVNFGNQAVATTSTPTPITVSNSGTGNLVITSLTIAGSNPGDFAFAAGTLPITVAPGSSATINVTFAPTSPGARSAGLNLVDNVSTSPQSVALSGAGLGPAASPNPTAINFGAISVNGSSAATTVTITNSGNANLVISAVALTGPNATDFIFTASSTPITVTPGTSTAILVTFQPKAGGSRSAVLSISSNAGGGSLSIPLSGTATGTGVLGMPAVTVGGNLEVLATATLTIAPPSSVTVTITSGNPSLVLLSTDTTGTSAGAATITVTIAAGATAAFPGFFIQGLGSSGTVSLTLSAPGYANATGTVTLTPSGFVLASPSGAGAAFATTLGSANTILTVAAASLDSSFNVIPGAAQLRGGTTVTVPVTSATPAVGAILGSAVFQGGSSTSNGVSFQPLQAGASVLSATAPAGFSTPASEAQLTATVNAPQISLYPSTVGVDLQVQGSGQLTVAAPSSGVQVTITSLTPSTVLLSTSPTAAGSASIILTVPANTTALPVFYVQGLAVGAGQLQASATGYGFSIANYNGSVAITPSGVVIAGPSGVAGQNLSTTTISNATQLTLTLMRLDPADNPAQVGQLMGGATVSVSVQSGAVLIGTIGSSPAVFTGAESSTSTILFNPLGPGSSVLSVIQPAGFSTPTSGAQLTATVAQPQISLVLPSTNVGANLELQASGSLNAPAPSAMNVTVSSSDPTLVLLSNIATAAGAATGSISVPIAMNNGLNGVGFPTFYVQALQSSGSVTLTASAPGWASGAIVVNLTPSGFALISPNGMGQDFGSICVPTSCASTTLTVQAMQLNPTTLAPQTVEAVAGGVVANVTVGDSDTSVGSILDSPVAIAGGTSSNVVVFQPLNTGTALLSTIAPGGFSTPLTGASLNAGVN